MAYVSAFCQIVDESSPYRIPNYKKLKEYQSLKGKTITFLPLDNGYNTKVVEKFSHKREFLIQKVNNGRRQMSSKVKRSEWYLKDVDSGEKYKLSVYFGDDYLLWKDYNDISWDDEVRIIDIPLYELKEWNKYRDSIIGSSYVHPLIKAKYSIVDLSWGYSLSSNRKDRKDIRQIVTVENSIDKRRYNYPLISARTDCFEKDKEGKYITSLVKVEKPENPEIQYGEIKVITDSLNKYSYSDNFIDIVIFGDDSEFKFHLKNNTQHTLKVLWEDASFVDVDGSTSKIMHNGVKFSERENAQSPSSIVRGASLDDVAIPTRNVYYSESLKDWEVRPMYSEIPSNKTKQVILMLPIQIKGVTNEYLFIFDINYEFKYPERINFDYWYSLRN